MSGGPGCIPLFGKDGQVRTVTLCDFDDAVKFGVRRYSQHQGGAFRGTRGPGRKFIGHFLHREILGEPPFSGAEVDHINGDNLDNQRSNLRWVTHAQNMQNRSRRGSGKSGYRGVHWVSRAKLFRAEAMLNWKAHFLGYFKTAEEADRVAEAWRRAHMTHTTDRP